MKKEDKILGDQAWAHMESILDTEMPQKKKRRFGIFWWIGLSALVVVSIFLYMEMDEFNEESVKRNSIASPIYAGNVDDEESKTPISSREENEWAEDRAAVASITDIKANAENINAANRKMKLLTGSNSKNNSQFESSKAKYKGLEKSMPDVIDQSDNGTDAEVSMTTNNQTENHKTFDSKRGRNAIKQQLNQLYGDEQSTKGFKKSINEPSEEKQVESIVRELIESLIAIPTQLCELDYSTEDIAFHQPQKSDVVNTSKWRGDWRFGAFTSYQYLDKYFKGYDLGISTTYHMGRVGVGLKLGYEEYGNTTDQVLGNAKIGVPLSSPENTILQSSRTAGFKLNDLILQKNNLMTELTLSYNVDGGIWVSSGLGYKRLLDITTRSIIGYTPDSTSSGTDFDPNALGDVLFDFNGNQVLSNPTVNRNRFYIPIEVSYMPIDNLQLGVGTQLFLNNSFDEFDEKDVSLYLRMSFSL